MEKFTSLTTIHHRKIVDPSGEHVGYVRDILLDLREGRIEYICIALPNNVHGEEAEAVVPWSAMRLLEDGDPPNDGTPKWEVAAKKAVLHSIAQSVPQRD